MSNKNTISKGNFLPLNADTVLPPSDTLLPPKTPLKHLQTDPSPPIYAILSPLPFPPKLETITSDLFFTPFPEMCEIKTPLPKERSKFMVEGVQDAPDNAIVGRIIFESSGEDDPNSNSYQDCSDSEEQLTPSGNSPNSQENSDPSQENNPEYERWEKEEERGRKPAKTRSGVMRDGTPGNRRVQCKCRKSKCLKLYCECFRVNLTCDGCNCVGCHNTEDYVEERNHAVMALLDHNPDPFGLKIEDQRHVKGCNCKKSGCLKKYCQCYQAGLSCGDNCKCENCQNVHVDRHDDDQEEEKPVARYTAKKESRMVEI